MNEQQQHDLAVAAFDLLRRLKRDLMHARRFMPDTLQTYRRACTSAEADIEEFLLEHRAALKAFAAPSTAPYPTRECTAHVVLDKTVPGAMPGHHPLCTGKGRNPFCPACSGEPTPGKGPEHG
jgi:hypothetical protein